MRGRVTLLAVAVCLSSAACGNADKKKDPVAFGAAKPAATTLPVTVSGDQIVGAAQWPSACTFLTDDEIKGLLPQADKINREPQQVSVVSIFDDAQNQTAEEGGCRYTFWLKGATIKGVNASIEVTISAIAAPSRITEHYDEALADDRKNASRQPVEDRGAGLGPQACYTWLEASQVESYVVCRQGALMFEVSGGGAGNFAGVADDLNAERDHWREKVQLPVVQMIASKIPAV
jgi:hypothetical protein